MYAYLYAIVRLPEPAINMGAESRRIGKAMVPVSQNGCSRAGLNFGERHAGPAR